VSPEVKEAGVTEGRGILEEDAQVTAVVAARSSEGST
jgi:hypothetical protein